MATYISCDGQPIVVNLDNCDFIKLTTDFGKYKIEFHRPSSKDNGPVLMCEWLFLTKEERKVAFDGIMKEHGSHIRTKGE